MGWPAAQLKHLRAAEAAEQLPAVAAALMRQCQQALAVAAGPMPPAMPPPEHLLNNGPLPKKARMECNIQTVFAVSRAPWINVGAEERLAQLAAAAAQKAEEERLAQEAAEAATAAKKAEEEHLAQEAAEAAAAAQNAEEERLAQEAAAAEKAEEEHLTQEAAAAAQKSEDEEHLAEEAAEAAGIEKSSGSGILNEYVPWSSDDERLAEEAAEAAGIEQSNGSGILNEYMPWSSFKSLDEVNTWCDSLEAVEASEEEVRPSAATWPPKPTVVSVCMPQCMPPE
jgi:hypothetical protein